MSSPPLAAAADQSEGVGIGSVLRHKLLLALFSLAGLAAGFAFFQQQDPVYLSAAKLMVTPDRATVDVGTGTDEEDDRYTLNNLVARIQGREFLLDAFARADLSDVPALAGLTPAQVVNTLGGTFFVKKSPFSDELLLSYRSGDPVQSQRVVEIVLDRFVEVMEEERESSSSDALRSINEARDRIAKSIEQAKTEYRQWQADSGLIWNGDGSQNVHAERLASIENQRVELLLQRAAVDSKLTGIQDAVRNGGSREAVMLLIDQTETAAGSDLSLTAGVGNQMLPLLIERELLLEEGKGKDHPAFRAIERKLDLTRSHLASLAGEAGSGQQAPDLVTTYIESLRQRIATIDRQIRNVDELYEAEKDLADKLVNSQLNEDQFRSRIDNEQRLYDVVVDKINEQELTGPASGLRLTRNENPRLGVQIPLHRTQFLTLGGLAGLFLGGVLAFLMESTDKRIRHPREIAAVVGAPVLGQVPRFIVTGKIKKAEPADIDGTVIVAKNPAGEVAESFRTIRAALASQMSTKCQVIQVTSPRPSDGKTTLTANLAASFTALGKRTLLIDCDLRRPRVSKLFGVRSDKIGLTDALHGELPLKSCVYATAIENLYLMPSGDIPANPSEALASLRFENVIERLRKKFDVILLDSPPMLAVSDAAILSQTADGVVLTMTLSKQTRAELDRCCELFDQHDAHVYGTVIGQVKNSDMAAYDYKGGAEYGYGSKKNKYFKPAKRKSTPIAVPVRS